MPGWRTRQRPVSRPSALLSGGGWTGTSLKGWRDQLIAQSIQPVQQFACISDKNAADAAIVIDAMDLLYSGRFDGFRLV